MASLPTTGSLSFFLSFFLETLNMKIQFDKGRIQKENLFSNLLLLCVCISACMRVCVYMFVFLQGRLGMWIRSVECGLCLALLYKNTFKGLSTLPFRSCSFMPRKEDIRGSPCRGWMMTLTWLGEGKKEQSSALLSLLSHTYFSCCCCILFLKVATRYVPPRHC